MFSQLTEILRGFFNEGSFEPLNMPRIQFLRLATPQDMWRKAKRELARFEADPSVDHAYNFFVTVFHIRDYAEVAELDVSALDRNANFELCRLACNSGKHLNLTGGTASRAAKRSFDSHADVAYEGDEEYALVADGQRIPVLTVGRQVLASLQTWLQIP